MYSSNTLKFVLLVFLMNRLKWILPIPLSEESCFHPLTVSNSATETTPAPPTRARRRGSLQGRHPRGNGWARIPCTFELTGYCQDAPKGAVCFILSPAVYGRSFHSLQLSHFKIFGNMMDVKWFMIFQFAFPLS